MESATIERRAAAASACDIHADCLRNSTNCTGVPVLWLSLSRAKTRRHSFLTCPCFTGTSGLGKTDAISCSFFFLDAMRIPSKLIIPCYTAQPRCPSGEIGRRTVFRSQRRKACWFESSLGHHRFESSGCVFRGFSFFRRPHQTSLFCKTTASR